MSARELFLQYGPPRTASTLAFQILCAAAYLRHADEPGKVLCRFSGTPVPSRPPIMFEVVKSHKFPAPHLLGDLTRVGVRVFATAINSSAENDWRPTAAGLSRTMRLNVTYTQITSLLARRGAANLIATDYAHALRLTRAEVGYVIEYIRYWSILRQCCGHEMSADWRAALRNNTAHVPHHDLSSPLHPNCEIYRLDAVERALMHSHIYQRFHRYARRIRSFSANDGEFDGTYCERSNAKVAAAAPSRGAAEKRRADPQEEDRSTRWQCR